MQFEAPKIITISYRRLAGRSDTMSLVDNKTAALWRRFQMERKAMAMSGSLYNVHLYAPDHFENFSPHNPFTKWVGIEIEEGLPLPETLEHFTLEGGLYAVFHHKGTDPSVFNYIYGTWLPASKYILDQRPHFEILGDSYVHGHPDSEEDIFIPIKPRS